MAIFYSATLAGMSGRPRDYVNYRDNGAVLRRMWFSWTGDAAQNDFVVLGQLPVGARVVGGRIDFTDFGSGITIDVGPESNPDLFLDGADVATAAGQANMADTAAKGLGYLAIASTASPDVYNTINYAIERVLLQFLGGNPDSGTVMGYVDYLWNK